ncbi:hypothetical protein SAMN02910358_01736 [Lachnospiraceae bacterium XBB1006]|nr:hypothetical protein SAMN02910358_01736 [Lachnospiraceae bacterium XBB1006]
MENRFLNLSEAKALYVVNKEAKKCRDLSRSTRQKLKKYLFEQEDLNLTSEEAQLLKDYGLDPNPYFTVSDLCEHHFKELKKWVSQDWDEKFINSLDAAYLSEADRDILSEHPVALGISIDERKRIGLSTDGCETIIDINNSIYESEAEYEIAEEKYNKYHQYLGEEDLPIRQQQQLLYNLKSCVLKVCSDEPVAYHILDGDDTNLGAYYIIHGFKFHEIVEWEDDIEVEEGKSVSNVSANNILAPDMTLQEALTILFSYLDLPDLDAAKFLNLETAKISDILNIDIVTPDFKSGYYSDCDECDDEYDDGYDEFI